MIFTYHNSLGRSLLIIILQSSASPGGSVYMLSQIGIVNTLSLLFFSTEVHFEHLSWSENHWVDGHC